MKKIIWIIIIIVILLVLFFFPKPSDEYFGRMGSKSKECKCIGFEHTILLPGISKCYGIPHSCVNMRFRFPDYYADDSQPIMFDSAQLTVNPKTKQAKLRLSIYNNVFGDESIYLNLKCMNTETVIEPTLTIISPSQRIPVGEQGGYIALIEAKETPIGIYICDVIASTHEELENAMNDSRRVSGKIFLHVEE